MGPRFLHGDCSSFFFKILKQNLAVHSFFLKNVLFLISVCLKNKIKSEIENLLRLSLKCKPCCELHTHHSIHWEKLVPSFQASMSVSDASWDDPWDVNWWVLLLSAHYIETQPFFCLGQFHNSWMWVSLTCCKSCHCSLQIGKWCLDISSVCTAVKAQNYPF